MWRANALGFLEQVGTAASIFLSPRNPVFLQKLRGLHPLYSPMSVTPCGGPMKRGEESLCGKCESQTVTAPGMIGACIRCDLGKGFQCTRHML